MVYSCLLEECPGVAHLIGLGFLFSGGADEMKRRDVPCTLVRLIKQGEATARVETCHDILELQGRARHLAYLPASFPSLTP
jgi:hypothetical protein